MILENNRWNLVFQRADQFHSCSFHFSRSIGLLLCDTTTTMGVRCFECPVCYDRSGTAVNLPCDHRVCISCLHELFRLRLFIDENGEFFECPECRAEILRIAPGEEGKWYEVDRIVGHVGRGRNILYWCRWDSGDLQPMKLRELRGCHLALKEYRRLRHRLAQKTYRRRHVRRA